MKRFAVSALGFGLLAFGCGDSADDKASSTPPVPSTAEPAFGAKAAEVPADQPGVEDHLDAHLNLQNLVHLADVDQGGLFIDFGTPARHKYTVGNWRTGWGKDGVEGDTTFTNVASNTGRVYLPLEGQEPLTLRFRLKPIGTGTMQLFLNGKPLPVVTLDKSKGFQVHDVALPPEVVEPGENHLLLRFGDTIKVGGEELSVAMDYLRVLRGSAAAPGAPAAAAAPPAPGAAALPYYASLVRELDVDGQKRRAIVSPAPTKLSWYVQVPLKAKLSLRLAQSAGQGGIARVQIRAEGDAEPTELLSVRPTAKWEEHVVGLEAFAGKLARLDLIAEGSGELGWSSPAILVPEVKPASPEPAKSVIVLLVDTFRADRLKTYDPQTVVDAPEMDAFSKEAVVFEHAQSPENWTKPSVASVLTGLYPLTHQTKASESKLPESALMVSEVFKKAGFATATFLANGYVSNKFGFDQGWDYYVNYIRDNKSTKAEDVFREAGNWIEKHKDQRFFTYIQTIDPHVPYDPPEEFLLKYDAREYTGIVSPRKTPDQLEQAKRNPPALTFTERDRERLQALHNAEISYHDRHFGTFVERLKKLGLYDKVVFVVTADHGEEFHEHGSYGHGHSVYQELIHVPFMVRWKGALPAGRVAETVGTLDISPTVLSAAGVAVPEVMEGVNRVSHMLGARPAGPAVSFSDFLDDRHVINELRWKLILRGTNPTLFDLQQDPGEQHELKLQDHPIAARFLRIHIGQFLGAGSRRDWLLPTDTGPAGTLKQEATELDEKTKGELKALGYAN